MPVHLIRDTLGLLKHVTFFRIWKVSWRGDVRARPLHEYLNISSNGVNPSPPLSPSLLNPSRRPRRIRDFRHFLRYSRVPVDTPAFLEMLVNRAKAAMYQNTTMKRYLKQGALPFSLSLYLSSLPNPNRRLRWIRDPWTLPWTLANIRDTRVCPWNARGLAKLADRANSAEIRGKVTAYIGMWRRNDKDARSSDLEDRATSLIATLRTNALSREYGFRL